LTIEVQEAASILKSQENDMVLPYKKLIPAVAYYRMSSDDQSTSIEQQRKEVEAYAKRNGYKIIREYIDYGKSGSKEQEKRVEFQRMLMESANGDFQAVLCWDAHRFARLDSIDGAFAKQILRANNIYLDTVKEGRFDWKTPEGRWKDMAFAEAGKAYSIDRSRDSLRGRRDALDRKSWPHGAIPYGYERLYIDEDGNHHRMRRIAKFRKPKHWRLVLVVVEEEARIVRYIFKEFVTRDVSYRQLARELNESGIPGPDWMKGRHGDWTKENVQRTLARKAYIGFAQMGYARKTRKEAFHRAEKAEKTGICPPILEGKEALQLWKDARPRSSS
jgi:DNA invertase Pin-like site-specific DNA recombinase